MSADNVTNIKPPKKSFMTKVMEDVEAKKAAKESGETIVPTPEEVAAKRLLKRVGLALVGTAAAVAATIVVLNHLKSEETDNEGETEETNSED